MLGLLPKSLEIGGKKYKIRTDYRVVLELFQAFNDETLTDSEKMLVCINGLFENPKDIPTECLEEALQKANWFFDGGDIPKSKATPDRTFDWKHDEHMIFSAVNKTAASFIFFAMPALLIIIYCRTLYVRRICLSIKKRPVALTGRSSIFCFKP